MRSLNKAIAFALALSCLSTCMAYATVTSAISNIPIVHFTDSNGVPLVGGKLFTYAAGTTTKQSTYTDSTAGTPNTNPVILNSRGEASVWFDQNKTYKLVLAPSTDTDPPTNAYWTADNLSGASSSVLLSSIQSQSQNYSADTGAVNAYVATLSPVPVSLTVGMPIRFLAVNANTGTSTLNVNGLGAVTIHRQDGSNLQTGDIVANQLVFVEYDGTYFQIVYAGANLTQVSATVQAQAGNYAADSGTSTALVITPSPAVTAYASGLVFRIKVANTNGASPTLNVSSLGAKSIYSSATGSALVGSEMHTGGVYSLTYDGTNFYLAPGMSNVYEKTVVSLYSNTASVTGTISYSCVGGGGGAGTSGNGGAGGGSSAIVVAGSAVVVANGGSGGASGYAGIAGTVQTGSFTITGGQTIAVYIGGGGGAWAGGGGAGWFGGGGASSNLGGGGSTSGGASGGGSSTAGSQFTGGNNYNNTANSGGQGATAGVGYTSAGGGGGYGGKGGDYGGSNGSAAQGGFGSGGYFGAGTIGGGLPGSCILWYTWPTQILP